MKTRVKKSKDMLRDYMSNMEEFLIHPMSTVDIDYNYEARRFLTPRSDTRTKKEKYTYDVLYSFNNRDEKSPQAKKQKS